MIAASLSKKRHGARSEGTADDDKEELRTFETGSRFTVQGEDAYEVEQICSRRTGFPVQYLVRWKGLGKEDDSWEPCTNLTAAKELVSAYNASAKSAEHAAKRAKR